MTSLNRNNFQVVQIEDQWVLQYPKQRCYTKELQKIPLENIFCITSSKDYSTVHYLEPFLIPNEKQEKEFRLKHLRLVILGTMKHFERELSKCVDCEEATFLRTHRKHITNQKFVSKISREKIDERIDFATCLWIVIPERINISSIEEAEIRIGEGGLPNILFPLSRTGVKVKKAYDAKKKEKF